MRQIQESLNEGYCDVSGRVGDLTFVGEGVCLAVVVLLV